MHLRNSITSLLTVLVLLGCSRSANFTELGEHRLSSCVIEKATRPPDLGDDWTKCKDQIIYTALITRDSAPADGPSIVLHVREQDRAALEAFLSRNMYSTTALRKGDRVLSLAAVAGSSAGPVELYLEPDEASAFEAALK